MDKSPDAFRTISEVAEVLDTPAHVLRFWESRFPQIRPVKRAGGRRYYRPSDVALLTGIKRLLHDEGLTIRGVQKILRDQGARHVAGLSDESRIVEALIEDATPLPEDSPDIPAAAEPEPEAPPPERPSRPHATAQPALPLFEVAAAQPAPAQPAPGRPERDDRTLASLARARARSGALADPSTVALLARRLQALRQTLAARADGGPG